MTVTEPARGQFQAIVVENFSLCREHFRLVLSLSHFPPSQPGQFVQLACRTKTDSSSSDELTWDDQHPPRLIGDELTHPTAMLRRPFSLAGRRDVNGKVELDIIHRVVGVGTTWLSELKLGDEVGVLGPLGNKFTLPESNDLAVMVGGGVGIPPMIYLAEKLQHRPAVVFAGALTKDLLALTISNEIPSPGVDSVTPLFNTAEFSRYGIPSVITTDDGSYGYLGYVTQALETYLDQLNSTARPTIYTCGPEPMMKRIADIANRRNIPCQIAVERAMACGMGTCQSCCIKVKKPDASQPPLVGKDWAYRLACTDGPVFRSSELLW